MPTTPEGYTHVEDAVAKWGRYRNWWYEQVREGHLPGYTIPGLRGTFLRDEEVEPFLKPRPIERKPSDGGEQAG
jgi:hypothetical protein